MIFKFIDLVYAVRSTVWGLAVLVIALIVLWALVYSVSVLALKHSAIPEDVWRR